MFDGQHSKKEIIFSIRELYKVEESQLATDLEKLIEYLAGLGYINQRKTPKLSLIPIQLDGASLGTKLVNAEIEITNKCNLSCKYCYAESNSGKPELALKDWHNLLLKLHRTGLRSIIFSGGEPFCRKDVIPLLKLIHNKFIISINTNGTLISEEIAEIIKTLNLKRIQVSLDSIEPEYHDSMRGKGSWEKAIKGIRFLQSKGVPVRISCTVTAENEDQVERLKLFCKKNGFEFSPEVLKPCGYAKTLPTECFSKLCDDEIAPKINFSLNTFDTPCQAQLGFGAIGSDGFIKPCNLSNSFFEKVSPEIFQSRSEIHYSNTATFKAVQASCEYEKKYGRKLIDNVHYDYPQCVLERYKKALNYRI